MVCYLQPFTEMETTLEALDHRVSEYKKLRLDYDLTTFNHRGTFNLAFNTWLTNRRRKSSSPIPRQVTTQIIWLYHMQGGDEPAGKLLG